MGRGCVVGDVVGEQGLGLRTKHRFSATEKRRQIPAEEVTGSWDPPYYYPWSEVACWGCWGSRVRCQARELPVDRC